MGGKKHSKIAIEKMKKGVSEAYTPERKKEYSALFKDTISVYQVNDIDKKGMRISLEEFYKNRSKYKTFSEGIQRSAEFIENLSKARSNYFATNSIIWICHKSKKALRVKLEDLEKYQVEGYVRGRKYK
jgi:hypothetical protein